MSVNPPSPGRGGAGWTARPLALILGVVLGLFVVAGCSSPSGDSGADETDRAVDSQTAGVDGGDDGTDQGTDDEEAVDGDTGDQDGSSETEGTPGATDEDGVRFRTACFAGDGRELGDFQSLAETWASSNYLRIEYCEARYVGPEPLALTLEEEAVAEVAAPATGGDLEQAFLETLAACTRLGAGTGENSIEGTPLPILQATLELCPQAPQADLIANHVEEAS